MILGFDFGMKFIGVATGQLITKTATPLTCLRAVDGIPDWKEIEQLITIWKPNTLLVGIPLHMDGSSQLITNCATKFAKRLQQKFKLPTHLVDERLSTWEAKHELSSQSSKLNSKKLAEINAQAAAIIVQQWLYEQ